MQYDVSRPKLNGGDILVRDGYFVHFISPENLPPINKNIVFVIDQSGSMSWYSRMDRLKIAFQDIINDLNEGDNFQIVGFAWEASTIYSSFQPVNSATKADAISRVSSMGAYGATNISGAMSLALDQRAGNNAANIIVFLTDGFPTAGERNWARIRDGVLRENDQNYAIFSLAIGSGAPYADMERMSTLNNGIARQIFDSVDVPTQIEDFYNGVASPLVWNAKIAYRKAKKVIISNPNMFVGQEMVIMGKLDDPCVAPEPICNSDLLVNENGFCSSVTDVSIDCDPRPTVTPYDPNDQTRDKMDNPKIPLDSDIDLEKYYNYLEMQGWLAIYKVNWWKYLRKNSKRQKKSKNYKKMSTKR